LDRRAVAGVYQGGGVRFEVTIVCLDGLGVASATFKGEANWYDSSNHLESVAARLVKSARDFESLIEKKEVDPGEMGKV